MTNLRTSNPFIRGIGLQDHLITTDPQAQLALTCFDEADRLGGDVEPLDERAGADADLRRHQVGEALERLVQPLGHGRHAAPRHARR